MKIKDIKGEKNIVTDNLSHLNYAPTKSNNSSLIKYMFSLTQHDTELFSLSMNLISAMQDKDDKLIKRIL